VHEDGSDFGIRAGIGKRLVGDQVHRLARCGAAQAAAQRRTAFGVEDRLEFVAELVTPGEADFSECAGGYRAHAERDAGPSIRVGVSHIPKTQSARAP